MNLKAARSRFLRLGIGALCLWVALVPVAGAEVTADDPVIADIVRMLDAGLEPGLIRNWLDSGSDSPGPISANDMIVLAGANAPAELIADLLQRSTRSAVAEETPGSTAPVPNATKDDRPSRAVVEFDADDCCLIDFSVEYRAPEQGPTEQNNAPRGDLYLYLDGQFVDRFAPRGEIASSGPRLFKYRITPGTHTIRLTRELHLPSKNRNAGDSRDHQTTVSPSSIEFELQPGSQWSMDIRWAQGVFSLKRPLHWRLSKDGAPVAGEEHSGEFQEDWPFLCDDVEISRRSGAIAGWRANDRSRNCVTWASLWPQGVDSRRAQILAEFETAGFQPGLGTFE